METIEEKIIEELGYNKESYEAYAAQEDIVAAIHKAQQYERERCIQKAQDWFCKSRCNIYRNNKCDLAEDFSEARVNCFFHSQIRKAIEEK